jgi:molybdopterin-guanine dinucleotide biosynthesis protein
MFQIQFRAVILLRLETALMRSNVRVMALSEAHNDRDEDNKKQDTTPTSKAEADEIASVGRILSDLATLDLEPNVTDVRCEIVKCIAVLSTSSSR